MTGAAFAALLAVAAALAAVVGLEARDLAAARQGAAGSAPVAAQGLPVQAQQPSPAPSDVSGLHAQWAATVLARPLFARDRRPAAAQPVAAAGAPVGMPRLAGVVVHGNERSAILVPPDGGKPVVAREGTQVGAVLVQTIQAGQVTVSGPGGTRVLRPSFDPRGPAATAQAAAPPPAMTLTLTPGWTPGGTPPQPATGFAR